MRQGQQNRRGRGRGNGGGGGGGHQNRKGQHHHNPLMRTYQSNGPDQKIHGTPAQIAEKYMSLARDALSSGDPVLAENYLQHAEHYNRIILTYREQQMQQQGGEGGQGGLPRPRHFGGQPGEPFDPPGEGEEEREDGGQTAGGAPQMAVGEQQQRSYDPQQGGHQGNFDQRQQRHQGGDFRGRDRDRDYGQGQGQGYGQGHGQYQGHRDRDRDGNRQFRQRMGGDQQRYGQDRGDRGPDMRGDRFDRQDRDRQDRDRPDRDRPDRDRQDRFDRQGRGEGQHDRPDRGDRPERGERHDRMPRPAPADRGEMPERQPQAAPERSFEPVAPVVEPSSPVVAAEAAPAPAPRRREPRFAADAQHEQPEFLRRPVRRPRREAATSEGDDAKATVRGGDAEPGSKD